MDISASVVERFWDKVRVGGPNHCWLWSGTPTYQGYGQLKVGRSSVLAHRIAYEIGVGPIPPGQEVSHRCPNYHCMNWRHLKAGSHGEHMQWNNAGENHYAAEITHCPSGHLYDAQNTYRYGPNGIWRRCRACHREEALAYWHQVASKKRK